MPKPATALDTEELSWPDKMTDLQITPKENGGIVLL
jgi:hypothetical protein